MELHGCSLKLFALPNVSPHSSPPSCLLLVCSCPPLCHIPPRHSLLTLCAGPWAPSACLTRSQEPPSTSTSAPCCRQAQVRSFLPFPSILLSLSHPLSFIEPPLALFTLLISISQTLSKAITNHMSMPSEPSLQDLKCTLEEVEDRVIVRGNCS
eukprot:746522-Hanusia_phi.AAC.2